ncbi:MAG: hypothetical protein RR131_09820 [Anaerovorax sp.]
MNKEEANQEAKKIYDDWVKENESIEKKAKEEGRWNKAGLDSNSYLFKEANKKVKEKLAELSSMIDEE